MKGNSMLVKGRFLPLLVWVAGLLIVWEALSWVLLNVAHTPLAQSKLPYVHELISTLFKYGGTLLKEGPRPSETPLSAFCSAPLRACCSRC